VTLKACEPARKNFLAEALPQKKFRKNTCANFKQPPNIRRVRRLFLLACVSLPALFIPTMMVRAQMLAPSKLKLGGGVEARTETTRAPRYVFKTADGKKESALVITEYYPKQIVSPFGKVDRQVDPKLLRAATIAEERAHAHSRSLCWHYVKDALLASGVIDSRPKTEYARDAAQELVTNYGFTKLAVRDPFAAPVGSVLVYGPRRAAGHVEFRTKNGFVSDFRSPTPSRRPLIGVYAKL
jgi:hypothetical protein